MTSALVIDKDPAASNKSMKLMGNLPFDNLSPTGRLQDGVEKAGTIPPCVIILGVTILLCDLQQDLGSLRKASAKWFVFRITDEYDYLTERLA